MEIVLARNWWSLVLRGLLAIGLGLVMFVVPRITLAALVMLFGVYALIDGIVSIVGAVRAAGASQRWGALLFEGVAGILAGAVAIGWPAITAIAFIYLIAAWAIITGIFEVAAAIRLRKYIEGEWLLALIGVLSVVFGFLLTRAPAVGAVAIALWIGTYTVAFGVLLVFLGFRLRSWKDQSDTRTMRAA